MAIENIFPPIPSEVVLPMAGFLTVGGDLTLIGVVVAGTLGSLIGAIVLYYVGLWCNEAIIRRFVRRFGRFFLLSEADLDGALAFFTRHGPLAIFIGRLIPLVRSLISIPAGMQRMPLPIFILYTTASAAIWSFLLAYAGVILGRNWDQVLTWIGQYQKLVLAAIIIGLLVFVYLRVVQPKLRRGAA